jgi:hypothetical protein
MFFLHNVFKMFLCYFRGFGLGHSVVGQQAHDLGQDRGAVQLVISVESVSVERIGFGRGFILGRGFVLGRILGDLVSRDLVIGLLKH